MKLFQIILKGFKEQIRSFWILILTVTMAPFFVGVYYLISEATQPHYGLAVVNQDRGIEFGQLRINHGDLLLEMVNMVKDSVEIPLSLSIMDSRQDAERALKNRREDALIVIPGDFSEHLNRMENPGVNEPVRVEFIGDLTNVNYMITSIWAHEILNRYVSLVTQHHRPVEIREVSLGISGKIDDFDAYMPGILILSIIMLMFTATIAIVMEVEYRTIIRLKLSRMTALEFLTGVSVVQVVVGMISIFLTLITAVALGFDYVGSLGLLVFIAVLTSISIIAFSLILAAFTKTVNEVLVVGNFPLFLFMFFTGAAFPMKGRALFTVAGYPISLQGLMSPTHAISALKKVLIMDMKIADIMPELTVLLLLTVLYSVVGWIAFSRRHMRVS